MTSKRNGRSGAEKRHKKKTVEEKRSDDEGKTFVGDVSGWGRGNDDFLASLLFVPLASSASLG